MHNNNINSFFRPAFGFSFLSLLLVSMLLTACTHNNGDIGNYFGSWAIDSIELDGVKDKNYPASDEDVIQISFQSDIFKLATSNPDDGQVYGSWNDSDGKITLNNSYNAGSAKSWPSALGFGPDQIVTLQIVENKSKSMVWRLVASDGVVRTYYLRKLL